MGVSSSAALEVAALCALEAASGHRFGGTELARLAQRVRTTSSAPVRADGPAGIGARHARERCCRSGAGPTSWVNRFRCRRA